jgi:alpha-L-fucosidase
MAYNKTSPWFDTTVSNGYLGKFNIRPVSAEPDDIRYTIDPQYNYRPDLLSFDLYGTPKLWWVFTQRNMNVIRDPIFDFKVGTTIFIPKKSKLFKLLGL